MANDLMEAYHDVFNSSKEILKNKQRNLYINMLDLLTRTLKASNASSTSKDLITDEYMKFFCTEILPLLFDDDKTIQDNAVLAIEVFLSNFDTIKCHDMPEWPVIKANIIEKYSEQLRSLQKTSNSNWYKIWCQLIRILDKEILRANCINVFLTIVESSFRSNEYQTRSEAFICWKCLIEIFSKYNEISSTKRIKLLCIPLKSSQARSLESSINKFKVWWCFLCKLGTEHIEQHLDETLEEFLQFCFGYHQKQQQQQQQQSTSLSERQNNNYVFTGKPNAYPIVKQMSVACFIEMLGTQQFIINLSNDTDRINLSLACREIRHILETKGLEIPNFNIKEKNLKEDESSSLISLSILSKSSKHILNAAFESTIMILEHGLGTKTFFKILWKILCSKILQISTNYDILNEFLIQFNAFLNNSPTTDQIKLQLFNEIFNELFCLSSEFPFKIQKVMIKKFCDDDFNKLGKIIWNFTKLLINYYKKYIKCSKKLEEIIKNLYDMKRYRKHISEKFWWEFQINLMEILMKSSLTINKIENNDDYVMINITIWKIFTLSIIDYLNSVKTLLELRQNSKHLEILNEWLLWPINLYFESSGTFIQNDIYDRNNENELIKIWKNLAMFAARARGKMEFSKLISIKLKKIMCENEERTASISIKLGDIIDKIILSMENKFDSTSIPSEVLELITYTLSYSIKLLPFEEKFKIISSFFSYLKTLGNEQIIYLFSNIKLFISSILRLRQQEKNSSLSSNLKCLEDEISRYIQDKLKTCKDNNDKKLLKEFKDFMKNCNKDDFVIIPTVWSLNPDRLTEHQKEKMKEKRHDIPALYNDISQSMDTTENSVSIKPWTPNKIVIAKGKNPNSEIAISPSKLNDDNDVEQQKTIITKGVVIKNSLNDTQKQQELKNDLQCKNLNIISPKLNTKKQQQQQGNNESPSPPLMKKNDSTAINSESVLKTQRSPIKTKLNSKISHVLNRKRCLSTDNQIILENNITSNETKVSSDESSVDNSQKSLTKNIDQILSTFNIQLDNEEQRQKVIKQLKSIKIDTNEGNTLVEGKLRRRSASVAFTTKPSSIMTGDENDSGGIKRRKRAKILLNKEITFDNDTSLITTTPNTVKIGEVTLSGRNNKSTLKTLKPARKSLSFEKEKHVTEDINQTQENNSMLQALLLSKSDNVKVPTITTASSILTSSNTNQDQQESVNNDSSIEEIIGSSQQCESAFTKRFMLRKSMTPTTPNRSSPKEKSPTVDRSKKETQTATVIENPTVPDDLNSAHIPTKTASEGRQTIVQSSFATENIKPNNNQNETTTTATSISTTSLQQQNLLSSSPSKSKINDDEADTESFNQSLSNQSSNSSRLVNSGFTINSSSEQITTAATISTNQHKIAEDETELNTENTLITPNKEKQYLTNTSTIKSVSDVSKVVCNYPEKSINCLARNLPSRSGSVLNKSVQSSPEFTNIEERTAEFLHNTLEISPITTENENITSDNDEINTDVRNNIKCTSPIGRKLLTKASIMNFPSSPPDRKTITAVCSPAIKPKPISQLMGRGAQFIQMIRNKNNIESSTKQQLVHSMSSISSNNIEQTNVALNQIKIQESQIQQVQNQKINSDDDSNNTTTMIASNPLANSTNNLSIQTSNYQRDLLVFSKTLPPPNASPSASILKRKFNKESFDETTNNTIDSPMVKRKRVSFHDPPVSVTKEYVKHFEENHCQRQSPSSNTPTTVEKPHFTRCLMPENTSTPQNVKKFKRMCRADSMVGIEKFTKVSPPSAETISITNDACITKNTNESISTLLTETSNGTPVSTSVQISTEMDSLKWNSLNDTHLHSTTLTKTTVLTSESIKTVTNQNYIVTNIVNSNDDDDDDGNCITPSPTLYFPDEQSMLKYIFEKYSIEQMFEKYLTQTGKKLQSKSVNSIIKNISDQMLSDSNLKRQILEQLSESHPIEFLEYAIQENLNSTVCDKLNSTSIIEYICEKSKLQINVRKLLLERVQNLLKLDKLHQDLKEFIMNLFNNNKLTNDEIINYIRILVSNQQTNNLTKIPNDNQNLIQTTMENEGPSSSLNPLPNLK